MVFYPFLRVPLEICYSPRQNTLVEMHPESLIVVTGAAGMIGSGIVRELNDRGLNHLLLVDVLGDSEKWKNLLGKQFIDLITPDALLATLLMRQSQIKAIIHMGACSDTEEKNGDFLLENNTHYSVRLAEFALSHNIRFIYASSAATYGDGKRGFSDDEEKLSELCPLNMYGYSKHLFDLWLKREKAFSRVVGLKYFNVFGPNEYHKGKMASMVLKMAKKVSLGQAVQLYKSTHPDYSDGEQQRDFIYLKDVVKMTCDFLQFPNVSGLFNIGRGKSTGWNYLAKALFDAFEKKEKIEYVSMPENLSRQYQNYTCAEMQKYYRFFPHFRPTPIADAVRDYAQNYLVNEERW